MADFEVVFGTLETGYLQEKKFLGWVSIRLGWVSLYLQYGVPGV